jgi:phosphonate transport system substrate-binding protein
MQNRVLIFPIIVLLLAGCAAPAPTPTPTAIPTEEPAAGRAIVLGDISDDPGEVIEGDQPLADYLAAHLADYGISEGQVRVATSADEMAKLLSDGDVDLYFDSVYPAFLISEESGAKPILRRWRYGVEEYHTVLFALNDSGIESVDDLPGHMVAFDNQYSTSGYVLPAVYLLDQGLTLSIKQSYNDPVGEGEVGFVFSFDDSNTLQWVMSELVSAGATDDVNYNLLFPDEARDKTHILAETESVPRQVVMIRPGVDPDLEAAIIDVLLHIHEDPTAADALDAFDKTTRFDEFPEGIEAALDHMRELKEVVQSIPTN